MKMKKQGRTQGNIKMVQLLEDLGRNKVFLEAMEKLNESFNKIGERGSKYRSVYAEALSKYQKLFETVKKDLAGCDFRYSEYSEEVAGRFHLDKNLREIAFNPYLMPNDRERTPDTGVDMCTVRETHDDMWFGHKQGVPAFMDPGRVAHIYAYPVSIELHRFAAKRDVLDFVEQNWDRIHYHLSFNEKPKRFRTRRHSRVIVDLIWENRVKTTKAIKAILEKSCPGNGLIYTDITQILRSEKKRRLEDLA